MLRLRGSSNQLETQVKSPHFSGDGSLGHGELIILVRFHQARIQIFVEFLRHYIPGSSHDPKTVNCPTKINVRNSLLTLEIYKSRSFETQRLTSFDAQEEA